MSSAAGQLLVAKKRDPKKGFGTLGTKFPLAANQYQLKCPTEVYFYHYDVDMAYSKEEQAKGDAKLSAPVARDRGRGEPFGAAGLKLPEAVKKRAMDIFRRMPENTGFLNGSGTAYDGEKSLYSTKEFKIQAGGSYSETVTLPKNAEGGEKKVKVTVQPCRPLQIAWNQLEAAVAGRIQILPIVSARLTQWKVTLNLDKTNTVFYKRMKLLDFLNASPASLNLAQGKTFEREVKTLKVETNHGPSGIRRVRITGVAEKTPGELFFEVDGQRTNVKDYFEKTYGYVIKHPELPCLKVGTKGNFMPIELCTLLEQKCDRRMTPEQTRAMVKACSQPANERRAIVQDISNTTVKYDTDPTLKAFGISVDKEMVKVEGRHLDPPVLLAAPVPKDKTVLPKTITPSRFDGTFDPSNVPFYDPATLTNWVAFVVCDDRQGNVQKFLDRVVGVCHKDRKMEVEYVYWDSVNWSVNGTVCTVKNQITQKKYGYRLEVGQRKGMRISPSNGKFAVQLDWRSPNFEKAFLETEQNFNKNGLTLEFIMVFLDKESHYAEVKKAGDILVGLPTQVVRGVTLRKWFTDRNPDVIVGNVLLKVNAKLGGSNIQAAGFGGTVGNSGLSSAQAQSLLKFTAEPTDTIVSGADVTHPSPGESNSTPSIAAVVACHNQDFTKYSARVRAQGYRDETVGALEEMVCELMAEFRWRNRNTKPKRIIFYRDGVSEGQFRQVLELELAALQSACRKLDDDNKYRPGITYIIVGKRHHTRIFCQNSEDEAGKAQNVPAGTVVDTGIVHFSEMDYFLCSHGGIQGTSRPAHYNVLYDDADYSADEIETFSYYLTYCYARCNRSISIPAPLYYAHHVAFRARHHLSDANGSDTSVAGAGRGGRVASLNDKIKVH